MAQPTSPFTQALSHLGRITLSSLPLDGALRLRDEINKLIDVNLRILSSNAQAENLSITNLINIAHIRERLQRLHVSVAQLDEILKRNIENLGRNLALDDSINDFERLMQLRDLSAYTVGFDCTTLEGLISRVVHELHATAERSTQSIHTAVEERAFRASPAPVHEIPETPQQSSAHNQNTQREAAASNEESRDSSPNKQDPPNDASDSDDSSDDEILVLRNRAASVSLTESHPGTPERGHTGHKGGDSSSDGNQELGDGAETGSLEGK